MKVKSLVQRILTSTQADGTGDASVVNKVKCNLQPYNECNRYYSPRTNGHEQELLDTLLDVDSVDMEAGVRVVSLARSLGCDSSLFRS